VGCRRDRLAEWLVFTKAHRSKADHRFPAFPHGVNGPRLSAPFQPNLAFGLLGTRLVPDSAIVQWTGLIATAAGIALAIWARFMLGGNWSATVKLKQNHTLIRNGLYAVVRHPIYSGFLLAMLGTASITGEIKGTAGSTLCGYCLVAETAIGRTVYD
jgi:protein-S-isoprenylcysteine O-methyltransferase Ste14